jgi:hypothetical protein
MTFVAVRKDLPWLSFINAIDMQMNSGASLGVSLLFPRFSRSNDQLTFPDSWAQLTAAILDFFASVTLSNVDKMLFTLLRRKLLKTGGLHATRESQIPLSDAFLLTT